MHPNDTRPPGRGVSLIVVFLLLAVSLSIHLIGITLPWRGPLDSAGSWYSHNADFLLTHGPTTTKLALVLSAGAVAPEEIKFRHTHPSFIIVWLALFRGVLGTGEWASRVAAIVLSLSIIFFTYLIARRITDSRISLLVLLVAVLMPMEAYWGRLPSESLAASAMMAGAVYFYISYRLTDKLPYVVFFFIFHFLGCEADWIAYPLPAALFFFEIIARRRQLLIPCVAIGLNFIYFGLFLLQSYWADGNLSFTTLFMSAAPWTITKSASILFGLGKVVSRIGLYFTIPLCLAAFTWLLIFLRGSIAKNPPPDSRERYLLGTPAIFLLVFIMCFVAFPNLIIVHEILLHPLSPFFPLTLGLVVSRRPRWASRTMVLALIVALMVLQLALVLAHRYSHQNGYPVDYPLSRQIESVTSYQDHVITHVVLAPRYYQFYCDRDLLTGINTLEEFRSFTSRRAYTKYIALDLASFSATSREIRDNLDTFTRVNRLKIDPDLLDYLMKHYPSERRSFLIVFDLTQEKNN